MAQSANNEASKAAPPQAAAKSAPRRPLSRRRKWLFRLAAIILGPTLVFGVLELSLRLGGYGYPTDFFLDGSKVEGAAVWIDNPDYGRRMFPRSLQQIPQPIPFVLPKTKKEGTYRIFVVGESAAQGFPDPSTSFARVLEVMLRASYPDKHFEVVNTAMVAINSHVALQIARDCARRQPDLIVVHLGNNEVVGPFGAAGVLGPFSPNSTVVRANLAVKTTRSGQLFDRLIQGAGQSQQAPHDWDGMAMFVNSQMRADDSRLPRIYGNFRENLDAICHAGEDAGVPVILCTIPVNLRDSAPFRSLHGAGLSGDQTAAWEKLYQAAQQSAVEKKCDEAIHGYEEADRIDPGFAELEFRLARCYAAKGDAGRAKQCYLRARDHDVLRFRSDTTINDTIREVAAAHEGAGVRLADAERTFAASSPGEVPGEDLFLEHVHMNFHGNYVLARTVFETLAKAPVSALGSAKEPGPLEETQCAERLARTEWSEWKYGTKAIEVLLQKPPFTLQMDHDDRIERLKAKEQAQRAGLSSGGLEKSVAGYQKAIQQADTDWMLHMNFGHLLTQCGRLQEASAQYEAVLDHLHHSLTAHHMVGGLELKLGRPRVAERHFRDALRLEPGNLEASVGLAAALEDQGKAAEAGAIFEDQVRKNPNRALAYDALGRHLYRAGKLDEAKVRLTEALEREPTNANIHVDLGLTLVKQENLDGAIAQFEEALRLEPEWPEVRELLAETKKALDSRKIQDRR